MLVLDRQVIIFFVLTFSFLGAYCVCIATALLQTAGLIPSSSVPVDSDDCSTWDEAHLDIVFII